MAWNEKYEPVIGLEVHAQLLTKSKAFCRLVPTKFGNDLKFKCLPSLSWYARGASCFE